MTRYGAVKEDLFVIGADGNIVTQWTLSGGGQLPVEQPMALSDLRDTLVRALP